jgi:RimJ/RimL family protein N-acetyltransferase
MTRNSWRGELVRLRAVEELDRYNDVIWFPMSPERNRDNMVELAKKRDDDSFFWIIEGPDGDTVGWFSTFDCVRRAGTFKYGIAIKHPFWGRGYGRDAVAIVLRYYFRELRYQKCTVLVYAFNERSLRFHRAMGWTEEGRLRRMVYTNGTFYDEIYFGMTKEEWDALDPPPALPDVSR